MSGAVLRGMGISSQGSVPCTGVANMPSNTTRNSFSGLFGILIFPPFLGTSSFPTSSPIFTQHKQSTEFPCGRVAASELSPNDACLSLSVRCTSHLLLMNRIWQRGWESPSQIKLQKSVTSVLVTNCLSLVPLACHSDEDSCHVWATLWRGPHGKEPRAASGQQPVRNWGPQWNWDP